MKQLKLSLFIIVLLSMTRVEMSASDIKIDGIYYSFTKSEAIVTYSHYTDERNQNAYSGDIVIPESVTYNGQIYNVTSISNYAFSYCAKITSVTIPNTITSIGQYAFNRCSGITSVIIPNSVTSIGGGAFYGCSSLSSFTFSDNMTTISGGLFEGCSRLSSIIIPNNITSIGNGAFKNCYNLNFIIIPNSVTKIGDSVFKGCSLKSITIGSGVTKIGKFVFDYTPIKVIWLTNTPPEGYENAEGCINYVVNDQYIKLFNRMVYPYLSSIFEYEGIRYVPVNPTEKTCDAIDCVYNISAAHLIIGKEPIYKGIEMTIRNVNPYFCFGNLNINTIKWNINEPVPNYAFQNCLCLQSIEIDDNTTIIKNDAFSGCTNLHDVRIGRGLLTIEDNAFQHCTALDHISIPSNVARICDYAFAECSYLKIVNFEESKTTSDMHRLCFENTTFNAGLSNKTYNFNVFAGDILYLDYSYMVGAGSSGKFQIIINGSVVHEITNSKSSYFIYKFDKSQSVELVISSFPGIWDNNTGYVYNIEVGNDYSLSLGSNGKKPLFTDCPLDTVLIGRNLHYSTSDENGYSPFYGNKYLKSIHITEKETKISDYEFSNCTNLNGIIIGDNIITIGNKAFSGCSSLEKIICGSNIINIGQEAFFGCPELKRFICHAITPPTCGNQALTDINKWNCTLSVPQQSTSAYQQADQWKDFFFIDNNLSFINKQTNNNITPNRYYDINGWKNKNTRTGLKIILMNNGTTRKVVVH